MPLSRPALQRSTRPECVGDPVCHSDLYGTSIDAVRALQNAGRVAVMSLDLAGVQQLKASGFPSVIVWVCVLVWGCG